MKIALCGSIEFANGMASLAHDMERRGYETARPVPVEPGTNDDDPEVRHTLMFDYFEQEIDTADAVLLYNVAKNGIAGYVGANTLLEAAHAASSGLEVFMFNPLPDQPLTPELAGLRPIVLDGSLDKLNEYYASLPRLHVSSQSPIKLRALSRALRRVGRPTVPVGYKTQSDVNEQPLTLQETYQGAMNRHRQLHSLADACEGDYYATIESGNDTFIHELGQFGCNIVILEQLGRDQKYGIDVDLAFPPEFAALVPSQYPDYGVLAQERFGSRLKDPYPVITDGRLTRGRLLEQAAWRVAVQLP